MSKNKQQQALFPTLSPDVPGTFLTVQHAREIMSGPPRFADDLQIAAKRVLGQLYTAKQVIAKCVEQDHMLTSERCPQGCLDFLPVYFRRVALDEFWADVEEGSEE